MTKSLQASTRSMRRESWQLLNAIKLDQDQNVTTTFMINTIMRSSSNWLSNMEILTQVTSTCISTGQILQKEQQSFKLLKSSMTQEEIARLLRRNIKPGWQHMELLTRMNLENLLLSLSPNSTSARFAILTTLTFYHMLIHSSIKIRFDSRKKTMIILTKSFLVFQKTIVTITFRRCQ